MPNCEYCRTPQRLATRDDLNGLTILDGADKLICNFCLRHKFTTAN